MDIGIVRGRLIEKLRKVKSNTLRKNTAIFIYKIKYKYKYMDNLQSSFIDLMIILQENNHYIEYKDYILKLDLMFKNTIYISNKDYNIRFNIDKVSWKCDIEFEDKNRKYSFNYNIDLHDNNIKFNRLLEAYSDTINEILNDVFNHLFLDYISNI